MKTNVQVCDTTDVQQNDEVGGQKFTEGSEQKPHLNITGSSMLREPQHDKTNNMKKTFLLLLAVTTIGGVFIACKKSTATGTTTTTTIGANVPAVYAKIYGASSITVEGSYIVIKTTGSPDHKSIYYPTSNSLYENFSGTTFAGNTFNKNPNSIATQSYTFKIPMSPAVDASHQATPLGAIGVSLNGVPFFNQYAGPGQPLTNEVVSFDQWWGHPSPTSEYHYHVEPKYLTTVKASKSALLGFLLDGFPVYGPEENSATVTNAMLDAYHGHTAVTADYPGGIYHYHITSTDPYINGSGYYGTPGTVTR